MEISLSSLRWEVKGYWPYVPIKETSMETGQSLQGVTDWLPAAVPGGVHYDLWRAGLIGNPYIGQNSLLCEWVEHRWWMYRAVFPGKLAENRGADGAVQLIFKGLDYEAEIFLNDVSCGSHVGMYEPFTVDITHLIRDTNTLLVLFKGIPEEMGQIGYTSRTFTQKSRFNYKWDFSTRLVNIGMWQDVVLSVPEAAQVEDLHWFSDAERPCGESGKSRGILRVEGTVTDSRGDRKEPLELSLRITGPYDRRNRDFGVWQESEKESAPEPACVWQAQKEVGQGSIREEIVLEDPCMWQPNGSGIPWLYELETVLLAGEETLWEKRMDIGIRSLRMLRNEGAGEDALPYTFCIGGEKTYIKGVNMVPLDMLYGNVGRERYAHMIAAIVNMGCNMARVWGGGLIETEDFYRLCDENGILVWQEFIQSSSGVDNIPCETPEYLQLLRRTAEAAVREKRSHVSLAVYGGGNELQDAPNQPTGLENRNIRMLQEIVQRLDGSRFMYPTSASGPREFVTRDKGVSHDVHGNWKYLGDPVHYELYGESDSLFHSEFGTDGVAHVKTLKKILPEEALHPTPMRENADWQHHGEWWGTYDRECGLFGTIPKEPQWLETFVACSQFVQSEGLRFILDADRKRAFQNSGTIIWQINEPWPNTSCTSLLDYFGETKSAYYQVKRCYAGRRLALDYRSLVYEAGTQAVFGVYAIGDAQAWDTECVYQVYGMDGTLYIRDHFPVHAQAGEGRRRYEIRIEVPRTELFLIVLGFQEGDTLIRQEPYLLSTCRETPFAALIPCGKDSACGKDGACGNEADKERVRMETVVIGDPESGKLQMQAVLENISDRVALETGVETVGDDWYLLGEDNYVMLLPGEKTTLRFALHRKEGVLFWEPGEEKRKPEFTLRYL